MPAPKKGRARRRKPSQARSRFTVDSILEAAARLFDQGSATTNGIAKLAGVSIGSLYEYFPNKDAILRALFEGHVREATDDLARALDAVPPETTALDVGIRQLVERMLVLHDHRPGLQQTFVARLSGLPALRPLIIDAERALRGRIEAWLRAHPQVDTDQPSVAARTLVEGTNALVHRFVEDSEGVSRETFVDELTRVWVRYLRADPT